MNKVFIHTFKKSSDDIPALVRSLSDKFPDFSPTAVFDMSQTHSTNIVTVKSGQSDKTFDDTDGLFTSSKGMALVIKTSDCIPLVISDKQNSFILASHLGWRGLHKGFVDHIFSWFEKNYSGAGEMTAYIGPCIRACCYCFSDEPVQRKNADWKRYIAIDGSNYSIDLVGFLKSRLVEHGVSPGNITDDQICTYHNHKYYSHLRSKNTDDVSGTMLTVVQL